MAEKMNAKQVLARMRRGDCPQLVGAGGFTGVFDNGDRVGHQTMRGLEMRRLVDRPIGSSVNARWTLAPPPRYIVKTTRYFGIGRKPQRPHMVVDTTTNEMVDEYKSQRAATMHARDLNDAATAAQVQAVKDRLQDPRRVAARDGVRLEAEQAGLSDDMVEAVVDSAMSAWEDHKDNEEAWEDLVASVIQGHAMP